MAEESTINLDALSLEELSTLRQKEESRLQALTARFSQLRTVAARLSASHEAVTALKASSDGVDVMVPMTESVYIPGKVKDSNKLLVELGTGFFCEKSAKDTLAYLERKRKLVDANSENVTKVIAASRHNIEAIGMALQGKLLEIRAKQEGVRHRAAVEG